VKGVLICGELKKDRITSVSKELITTGKRLASVVDRSLDFLLIGKNLEEAVGETASLGVDRVLTTEGPKYAEFHPERLASIITAVCRKTEPSIIILGQTDMGRDIAPRLAAKLGGGVCLDCMDLSYDKDTKELILTKPVYGGFALAQWTPVSHLPQVVTMRPRSAEPPVPDSSLKGKVEPIAIEVDETQIRSQLIETSSAEKKGIKLEEAKVIIAGGGGIGGSEGFALVRELADALGAAVGTTRVPSDEKWMPKSCEIGQTGHVVSPRLYIAVGISGAPQHMAGCSSSDFIVAINKDPQAPILGMADLAIIGDYREILPALIEKMKVL